MMKKPVIWTVCLLLALYAAISGARAEATDRFLGTWAAEGVIVNIRCEDNVLQCTAIFQDDDSVRDIWEYSACWYDEATDTIQCGGITRTQYRKGPKGAPVESGWSLDDMNAARFVFPEAGDVLIWTDDGMKAPVELTHVSDGLTDKYPENLPAD